MRFKGRMGLEHSLQQLDIAPIINVIFLLLIFLLFTPAFIIQPGIAVNLPKAVTSAAVKYENIEILVTEENIFYLNAKAITLPQLEALLKQVSARKQALLIKADRRASLGKIVELWDMARSTGISQINIATNQQ